MDDEIEILEEIPTVPRKKKNGNIGRNPYYQTSNSFIPQMKTHECAICGGNFDNKKEYYKHLGLEHYKSYLESELKNFFQEHWHCSRCSQDLASVKQALVHLAVNHKLAQEYYDEGYPPNEEKVEEEEVCEIISDDDEEIQALDRCFKCKMKSDNLLNINKQYYCMLCTQHFGHKKKKEKEKIAQKICNH